MTAEQTKRTEAALRKTEAQLAGFKANLKIAGPAKAAELSCLIDDYTRHAERLNRMLGR